jgi:hypothetical protein
MNTIELNLPFQKRHLRVELKQRGAKFNPQTKAWSLPDTAENQELAQLIERPTTGPTPSERIGNIAMTFAELLTAVGSRRYTVIEAGDRVVLQSDPLPGASVPALNEVRS